ncbi:hypothetical protein B0T16DRAFT_173384 [Cercophora newfieldiana]|uniref:Uncharacterized protein n=1 Tax=Cercophora newfieldiana TaxID=92897 RepID=A0AA39Y7J8_9PEZI|nr:hypothetical protein B0T16DRAFT_173384 [Cercophora newfieldiana]
MSNPESPRPPAARCCCACCRRADRSATPTMVDATHLLHPFLRPGLARPQSLPLLPHALAFNRLGQTDRESKWLAEWADACDGTTIVIVYYLLCQTWEGTRMGSSGYGRHLLFSIAVLFYCVLMFWIPTVVSLAASHHIFTFYLFLCPTSISSLTCPIRALALSHHPFPHQSKHMPPISCGLAFGEIKAKALRFFISFSWGGVGGLHKKTHARAHASIFGTELSCITISSCRELAFLDTRAGGGTSTHDS